VPARREFVALTVKDSPESPLEYDSAMRDVQEQINARLAQGAVVEHMTQSSTGHATIISIVFLHPADANQDRRHRP
jgi:hypothetical protein